MKHLDVKSSGCFIQMGYLSQETSDLNQILGFLILLRSVHPITTSRTMTWFHCPATCHSCLERAANWLLPWITSNTMQFAGYKPLKDIQYDNDEKKRTHK